MGETSNPIDVQAIVRQTLEEFVSREQAKNEPAYKLELEEERGRREQLERRPLSSSSSSSVSYTHLDVYKRQGR